MRTVTFYSYKGGTGRTLLLANLAVLAARLGQRVVAIDFDLEAPGLAYKLAPGGRPHAEGLVGWLRDHLASEQPPASLADYVVDLAIPEPLIDDGRLTLMPAGRAPSPNYFQDLRRLRLDQRLDEGSALDALVDLRRALHDELDPDLVLLDARTGITPTNSVTTHVLADEVVALTLDTPEQLEGTRAVLRALEPVSSLRTGEPLRLHVVLSRVPPKPGGASPFEVTPAEQERIDAVLSFLTEPAVPARNTLDVHQVHLVHTEPALTASEELTFRAQARLTRSAYHVDQWRVGAAVLGPVVRDIATQLLRLARDEPAAREELANLFAAPTVLLEVAVARARARAHPRAHLELGLDDEVATLRARVAPDPRASALAARLLTSILREVGGHYDVVAVGEGNVAVHRTLARADPAAHEANLARSLDNVSVLLSEEGQGDKALAAVEEAVSVYRRLARADQAAHEANLAGSLNNLSIRLGEVGRAEDALAAMEEAVALYRGLATADREAFEPDLAMSLSHLAVGLGRAGRGEEALAAVEEAVSVYRRLGTAVPATHEAALADSLTHLSVLLIAVRRSEEALAAVEEAVSRYRRLARADRAAFEPGLAMALSHLSVLRLEVRRGDDALPAVEEVVSVYRGLAKGNRAAYEANLAGSLNNLSIRLGEVGRAEDALAAMEEAVALYRRRVTSNRAAYEPALASSLDSLSNRLGAVGRAKESLAAVEEAVALRRRLAAANPAAHKAHLARSLNNLADVLTTLGRNEEAGRARAEADEIAGSLLDPPGRPAQP